MMGNKGNVLSAVFRVNSVPNKHAIRKHITVKENSSLVVSLCTGKPYP